MSALEDIQNYPKNSPKFKTAVVTMRQSNHTHNALEEAARVRVSHIRNTNGGGETSDSDCVFAEFGYERFLKLRPDVASSEYDCLYQAFIDKTFECSLLARGKAGIRVTFARTTPGRPALAVRPRNALIQPQDPSPSPSHHPETMPILTKDSKPKNPDKNA
jgi:hypothetical protein